MSLHGRRILITRTRQQASSLATQLEALGAIPILIPTIELAAPTSWSALDAALTHLHTFDWLLFTSANAVEFFHRRRLHLGLAPSQIPAASTPRIAAIGPSTSRAIDSIGLSADLLPPQYIADSLADSLLPHAPGRSFLLVRAEQARDILPDRLTAAGARVTIASAYRNLVPAASLRALQQLLGSPREFPDAITFTSASTATHLFSLLEANSLTLPLGVTFASIGPITSAALAELGHPPQVEASEPSIPALVSALEEHFSRPSA